MLLPSVIAIYTSVLLRTISMGDCVSPICGGHGPSVRRPHCSPCSWYQVAVGADRRYQGHERLRCRRREQGMGVGTHLPDPRVCLGDRGWSLEWLVPYKIFPLEVRSTSSSLRGAGHHVMVERCRRCFDSAQKQERDRRCEERCHHGREISCFDAKDM
jgi:hypothetical protein